MARGDVYCALGWLIASSSRGLGPLAPRCFVKCLCWVLMLVWGAYPKVTLAPHVYIWGDGVGQPTRNVDKPLRGVERPRNREAIQQYGAT